MNDIASTAASTSWWALHSDASRTMRPPNYEASCS